MWNYIYLACVVILAMGVWGTYKQYKQADGKDRVKVVKVYLIGVVACAIVFMGIKVINIPERIWGKQEIITEQESQKALQELLDEKRAENKSQQAPEVADSK